MPVGRRSREEEEAKGEREDWGKEGGRWEKREGG
jgi:hypothetical protein